MKGSAAEVDDHAELAPVALRRASRLGWLTGALLLAVLIVVATHLAEERAVARLLRESQPLWLLAAALLQLLTYVCAAGVWQRALAHLGAGVRLAPLLPLGLAKLFTDQALPSAGVSGTLLVVRGLERRGVPRATSLVALVTGLVTYYLAYLLAMLLAVAALWRHGELRLVILLPVAVLCLLAAGVPVAVLVLQRWAVRRPPRRLVRWLERWPGARDVGEALREAPAESFLAPRLLAEATALQLAIFALDALTLGLTLRAAASPVDWSIAFASFVVASVVSSLAWVPGGLGTFEGSCVALLHLHGVPVEGALAGTLLLRGLTFWLPMLPGFALARREAGPRPGPPGA